MRIKTLLKLSALCLLLASCSMPGTRPAPEPAVPQPQAAPVATAEPVAAKPGPALLLDSIDVVRLESFPVQVNLLLKGRLQDGCTALSAITEEHSGTLFQVTLKAEKKAQGPCPLLGMRSFEEQVPLSVMGLPAGVYAVNVNGKQTTFELAVDNMIRPGD